MPLMMDDDMDVDINDLFGDGGELSLPSRPPSKELLQRLDELRASGCCQTIAWSKWGSIASISPNGSTLEFRNLRCHPKDGTWGLSEPNITPQLTGDMDGGPLKHLCWSSNGAELAVIDHCGRVSILGLGSSINKPTLSRDCQGDPVDDLHAVVGGFWLNMQPHSSGRPASIINGPAFREGSSFRYEASQVPIFGPYHPVHNKSAFVCITTNGLLRVLWPQLNNKWYESHTELESIVSSEDLITHASICPDRNNTLLIAFATTSKQLRTVRAVIDWGLPKQAEKPPQGIVPLNPTVRTKHLAVTSWLQEGPTLNASHLESSMVQLSHLELLPASADAQGRMMPPVIVAVRFHLPISTSHYSQDVHTTVDRWEIRAEVPQKIHPAFEQLSSRRNSAGTPPSTIDYLRRVQSFTVNKIAIGMQPINLGKVICFAYADSSVDYRDRQSMAEVFTDNDLDRVWHLAQIGFSYTEDEPCLEIALSPTYCSMIQVRNDGKLKWKQLDYRMGDIGSSMEDPQYAAIIAALTLSCATTAMTGVNADDLMAVAHKHINGDFIHDWLTELAKMLKSNVDYSEEVHYDPLIRNTTIQLCLGIQVSLGFRGEFVPRTFAGKFGWIVLQLRNIVVLVTMAANMKYPSGINNERLSPLENPEVINALAGSIRWTLDLMAWLTDSLLTLPTTVPNLKDGSNLSFPDLLSHLRSTNNVSLQLLLCSATRGFLTAVCRRITHLDYIACKGIQSTIPGRDSHGNPIPSQTSLSPALHAAYLQIATLTKSANIKIATFENLLSSLTISVKAAYASQNPALSSSPAPDKARNNLELKMLFGGDIPEVLKPVVVELFGTLLPATREEIDPGKLFFMDFSLLEVDDDEGNTGPPRGREMTRRKQRGLTMDCFAKRWLSNSKRSTSSRAIGRGDNTDNNAGNGQQGSKPGQRPRWRRCARCASVMEDVLSNKPSLHWLIMQHRRCFCGGYWDTLQPGETVA